MKPDQIARRNFLGRVGKGMIVATVGTTVADELGISTAAAAEAEPKSRLTFGDVEPLVSMLQETPVDQLQPLLVSKLKDGSVDLPRLVKAAALSNARSFGGEDYVGMHTLMALKPAYLMSQQLPPDRRALVILKVLHRNTEQIHTSSDFASTRPAFRWRHLVGLARVTASEYGKRSPGYAQACELLGVET